MLLLVIYNETGEEKSSYYINFILKKEKTYEILLKIEKRNLLI